MAADPTLQFIRDLDDRTKYRVKEGVPIWVPHTRITKDAAGKDVKIVVKESDLAAYAANINRLESERGVLGRITDGHVTKENPTPTFVGVYREATVGTFGKKKTPAVLVKCYYRTNQLDVATNRPYRSPEVYTNVKEIRGLALLLKDPFLDMGNVTYDAAERPVCYGGEHMPADAANLGEKEQKAEPNHTPEEKALFEKCRQHMVSTYGLDENWPGETKEKDIKDEDGDGVGGEKTKEKTVTQMEKPEIPTAYAALVGELRAEVAGMKLERVQERCAMLIYSLEGEGFNLSPEEKTKETAKLVRLPEADRPERVKELKAIYAERRAPQGQYQMYGGGEQPAPNPADENDPFSEPWFHKPAENYMMQNIGTSYEAAVRHIKATQKK